MRNKSTFVLAAFAIAGLTLLPIATADAGINQSNGKRFVCKGEKSCDALKKFCDRAGGKYTPAGTYGACQL